MTSNLYVAPDHRVARLLWARIVFLHRRTEANTEYGAGYVAGLRDGMSEAYSTITGLSRQKVGDRARAEIARET